MICDSCQALFEEVAERLRHSDAFKKVRRTDDALKCTAKEVQTEPLYTAEVPEPHDMVWVSLATPDRWLNESIEAALVYGNESIEDMLEEELLDQGFESRLPVEHFRDEQKLYLFRSPVFMPKGEKLDEEPMINRVTQVMLAYEACFHQLGDMGPGA